MATGPTSSMLSSTRMSRRGLLRLAGTTALAGAAAGCAGAPETDTGGDAGGETGGAFTIYWNAGHDYQAYQQVIAEFEKAHGVTVNFQKYQWEDMRTRLLADFAAGTVPDLVEETSWTQEFAISGDALPLQKYVDQDGADIGFPDDWQPVAVERQSYQGKVYGVQLHLTCQMLFYNQAMLREAGVQPPTTWDELLAAARALTRDGVYGLALNQEDSYSTPFLLQAGVRYYDPDTGEVLTPRDRAVEALQFQADLVHKHKVSPVPVAAGGDYSGPQKLLSAGKAAMIFTGPWDLKPIRETSPDLELGIGGPLRRDQQAEPVTIAAGAGIFIPAKAKRPDLAWDFIKRITAPEVELAATEEADMLMPRISWAELPAIQGNETYRPFAEAMPSAQDWSAELRLTGKHGQIDELYLTLYQAVVMQNRPAEEAVAEFVEAAQKVLEG